MALRIDSGQGFHDRFMRERDEKLRNTLETNPNALHPLLRQLMGKRLQSPQGAPLAVEKSAEAAAAGEGGPGALSAYIGRLADELAPQTGNLGAGLGANLGANLGSAVAGGQSSGADSDELMDFLMNAMGSGGVDMEAYEQAMSDQARAIRRGYRGQIRGLRGDQDLAQERGQEQRGDVGKMYRALANEYRREGRIAGRQGRRAADEITNRAARSTEMLDDSANDRNSEIMQRAAELGISTGLEGVMPERMQKDNQRVSGIQREATRSANRAQNMGDISRRELREGGMASRREGSDVRSSMLRDEEDYIRGIDREIQGLRSQRAQEIAANRANTAAQIGAVSAASQGDMFGNALNLAKFQMDREQASFDNDFRQQELLARLSGQGGGGNDPIAGAMPKQLANYNTLTAALSPPLQRLISDVVNGENFGLTQNPDNTVRPMNPIDAAKMLQQEIARRRLKVSPKDLELMQGAIANLLQTVRY